MPSPRQVPLSQAQAAAIRFVVDINVATQANPQIDLNVGDIEVDVRVEGIDLDRPNAMGYRFGPKDMRLVRRLKAAIEAGAASIPEAIGYDVNGKTYLVTKTQVWGKRANADLRRLGF